MKLATIETWYLWMMIYSVIGWIYESALCSISGRKWVNRGFFNGPYCPIYGTGAVLVLLLLGRIEHPVLLFLSGAVLTCSLEYLTSYGLEKLFHARWWDYTKRRFNLGGRVCLLGAVVFGVFTVVLVKLLHPVVAGLTSRLTVPARHWICVILLVGFGVDLVVTVRGLAGTHTIFAEYAAILQKRRLELAGRLRAASHHEALQEVYETLRTRLNAQQRRTIRSFPRLTLSHNNEVLVELRRAIENAKKRAAEKRRKRR